MTTRTLPETLTVSLSGKLAGFFTSLWSGLLLCPVIAFTTHYAPTRLPVVGRALGLGDRGFGIWAGREVIDTSSVETSVKTFPWFVPGFVVTSVINFLVPMSGCLAASLVQLGKIMIIVATSAIGLSSDLGRLVRSGLKSLVLGLACWAPVTLVVLVVQNFPGLW